MRRIVFIDQSLNAGGAERVTATIIRSLDPEKFEIHLVVVSKIGELEHLIPKHVKVHELEVTHTRNAFFKAVGVIKRIQPDIVYSSLSRITILSVLVGFIVKFKSIARYPSMPSIEEKEGRLKGWRYLLMKLFYKRVHKVIAQTDEMALELQQFYKIDEKKIKVIINPIDKENIEESVENTKNPFKEDSINIVASGRMGIEKGFDVLINAFSKVITENEKFHLHILGKNSNNNRSIYEKQVRDLNIFNNVSFHGFQKNPYPYYKYCDLFVLSSRREGLPNVVLECQYLGKPVVATRCIPVIERLIDNGKNGYVVNVEDVKGLSEAILKYRQLKGEKIFRDSLCEFIKVFEKI